MDVVLNDVGKPLEHALVDGLELLEVFLGDVVFDCFKRLGDFFFGELLVTLDDIRVCIHIRSAGFHERERDALDLTSLQDALTVLLGEGVERLRLDHAEHLLMR